MKHSGKRRLKLAILAFAQTFGLFALARRFTREQARILCYHGFAYRDEHQFIPQLFMQSSTFEQRLQQIERSQFTVVSLTELVERLERGDSIANLLVITVDDGWTGFARFALPQLQQRRWPCTLYLTTWYAEKERPVLNVLRRYLAWHGVSLPAEQSDNAAEYAALQAAAAAAQIDLRCPDGELFRLSPLPHFAALAQQPEQPLDIQLHTHRHRLPLAPAALADELQQNRQRIEALSQRSAEHFCYPSGEYTAAHLPLLRANGVRSATTTQLGLVRRDCDRLQLPRILDGENLHPLELAAELSGFMTLIRRLRGKPVALNHYSEETSPAP
ncbi:polysaccharide deacetylase family protein [Permianibacter sp. IMCC34836]|uniref:polysaccharide deacetylase family protein n=1 Tax=Permianibacter fluminis TaxID=2738515 RepID=UPI0015580FF8|nr:polysaccharide deacetylase family protein [Permianibacter fluminis]NQD35604.1 polysaccharide deacetylase family protein [Permianibacter fluminis]